MTLDRQDLYLIASSIFDSRLVPVTSRKSSRHSSLLGASTDIAPYAPMSIL